MRTGGRLATTAAVLAAAVVACLGALAASMWVTTTDGRGLIGSALSAATSFAFTLVGVVIIAARPRNRVGWLMLAGGVTWALGNAGTDLGYHGIVEDTGSVPGASALAVGGSVVRSISWGIVTIGVPMVFPDGSLAATRWRWLPKAFAVVLVGAVVDPLTDPSAGLLHMGGWRNPLAPPGAWQAISSVGFLAHTPLGVVLIGACVAQLVSRWRQGSPHQRQQILLFAYAAALPIVSAPFAIAIGGGGWIFGACALPVPIAIGFAVLAKGLYDLRTAANRTLLWVTMSGLVVAAYAVVIAGTGRILHVDRERWVPWLAAAVIAVMFAPLRDGLQRGVNRITFGRWDEPYDVLAALGQRLEASADVDRLVADLVSELNALGLHDVSVVDDQGDIVAGTHASDETTVAIPLTAYSRPVGLLRYRAPQSPLRSRDRQLLDDLAGHLGGVLHARALTSDLQRARESLVLAREEERRRLRRDLHDGLGPALAGHLLQLEVIAGKLGVGSAGAREVGALRTALQSTVLEVRRVVEGLRPPALDELGLAGALTQVTSRLGADAGLIVELDVDDLPPLPAAIEVAAYRIVTEAMTNVVRHADATRCTVSVRVHESTLVINVTDNGHGVDPSHPTTGHGMQTMRERAEELRGRLIVTPVDGPIDGSAETTVRAELPLAYPLGSQRLAASTT